MSCSNTNEKHHIELVICLLSGASCLIVFLSVLLCVFFCLCRSQIVETGWRSVSWRHTTGRWWLSGLTWMETTLRRLHRSWYTHHCLIDVPSNPPSPSVLTSLHIDDSLNANSSLPPKSTKTQRHYTALALHCYSLEYTHLNVIYRFFFFLCVVVQVQSEFILESERESFIEQVREVIENADEKGLERETNSKVTSTLRLFLALSLCVFLILAVW